MLSTDGIFSTPKPINEPVRSYAPGSAERASPMRTASGLLRAITVRSSASMMAAEVGSALKTAPMTRAYAARTTSASRRAVIVSLRAGSASKRSAAQINPKVVVMKDIPVRAERVWKVALALLSVISTGIVTPSAFSSLSEVKSSLNNISRRVTPS